MQVPVFVHTLVRAGIIKGEVTGDIRNHTLSEISHQSPTADHSVWALFLGSGHLLHSLHKNKELGERQMPQHSQHQHSPENEITLVKNFLVRKNTAWKRWRIMSRCEPKLTLRKPVRNLHASTYFSLVLPFAYLSNRACEKHHFMYSQKTGVSTD